MISRLVKGGLFGKMAGIGIHSQNEGGSQEAKWMIDGEEDEKQCFLRTVEVAAQIWQVATGKDHRGEARHVGTRMIPIIAKNGMSQTIQCLHSTRTEWNHQRRVDFGSEQITGCVHFFNDSNRICAEIEVASRKLRCVSAMKPVSMWWSCPSSSWPLERS